MLELLDDKLLFVNNCLDQVTYRHDAREFLVIDYGQVTHALVGHQCHALFNGALRTRAYDTGCHDVTDRCVFRSPAREDYLSSIIPLRHDPHRSLVATHHQCANATVRHQLERIVYRCLGADRANLTTFCFQQLLYRFHAHLHENHNGNAITSLGVRGSLCEAAR